MPAISIIVPIYNVEQYLHKCIDSILAQTFTDFELILVDDGSPDKCGEICDEYSAKDKRVKVIHKANGGLSDARNAGLEIAKGDYIGFVDSDDWIEPNMYEILINLCLDHKADVSTCGIKSHKNNNRNNVNVNSSDNIIKIINSKAALYLLYEGELTGFSAWNKLYKKEIFNDLKFPKGRIYEDAAIMYRVFDVAKNIAYINIPLYNYNSREGSITKSKFSEKKFDIVCNYYETYRFMREKYPEMCEKLNSQLYSSLRTMVVDIIIEKSAIRNYKYINRISKIIKKNNKNIIDNKLISLKHKLLAQLLAWCPLLVILLYKIRTF